MAKSFAVWVEGKVDNNQKSKVCIEELHINFWCTRSPKINCMDFGIKFSLLGDGSDLDNVLLNVFIPFPISRERIEDLSTKMESNKDLVSAIFNDHVLATKNIKTKHIIYTLASTSDEPLALNTSIDFRELNGRYDDRAAVVVNHDHTKIIFKVSKCVLESKEIEDLSNEDKLNYYIRFRLCDLNDQEMNALIHVTENSDKYLKPLKDKLIVIDFRVNELRVLPKDIRVSLANACACPSKYHLFVIRDETDEYQLSHSGKSYKKCRILEGETWQKYFDENIFDKDQSSMIYHWEKITNSNGVQEDKKNKHSMTDFIAVAKFKQTESPSLTILIYLVVVVLVSIISMVIYDLIKVKLGLFVQ